MEPFHLHLGGCGMKVWAGYFLCACERKRKNAYGVPLICAPRLRLLAHPTGAHIPRASRTVRACGMELQQIIPGTLKQGYLTKSPPLDKGGIKVSSWSLMQSRNGGVALALPEVASPPAERFPESTCVVIHTRTKPPTVDSDLFSLPPYPAPPLYLPSLYAQSPNLFVLLPTGVSGPRHHASHWPLLQSLSILCE